MKNFNNLWMIVIVVVVALSSCYEEGPSISFRSKRDRLANEWICTDYTVDGQAADAEKNSFYVGDSLTLVLSLTRTNAYSMNMQYTKSYSESHNNALLNLKSTLTSRHYNDIMAILQANNPLCKSIGNSGKWSFMDKFKKIEFSNTMGDLSVAEGQKLMSADVLMLKNKSIKLKYDVSGKSHTVTFEPRNEEIVK